MSFDWYGRVSTRPPTPFQASKAPILRRRSWIWWYVAPRVLWATLLVLFIIPTIAFFIGQLISEPAVIHDYF